MKMDIFIVLVVLFLMITGCGDKDQKAVPSLPTRGELTIGIDESLRPVTDAEIAMFSFYYPDADITPLYLPEKQVLERLLSNEIQTGIICRDLLKEETEYIRDRYGHSTATVKLADDRIVAVVNNSNPADTLSYDDVKGILSGNITDWRQLSPAYNVESPIIVVITNESSIDRYLSSSAAPPSSASTYALDTTAEVMDYVKDNIPAIGIVGGSWFYKKGSAYTDVKLRVLSQGGQVQGVMQRGVYAVIHEPHTGLGNGFISFMAGQRGQLIIEKAGMTPYKTIQREIDISGSYEDW